MAPKVSVLMPVYNTQKKYLCDAIESVLSQTFEDFEFLILDDCPEQNVEDIVALYKDKRIKYIKNEQNIGISASRNKLIDMARGEYLAIMDHDDVSLAKRFEKQVKFLDKNPDVGVVGCWYERFPKKKVIKKPLKNKDIVETLLFSCCILHPSSMIRKEVLIKNNVRYEEKFSPSEDYALWCRLIGKTEFANIPEVLFKYRDHKSNTTHEQSKKMSDATVEIYNFVRKEHAYLWNIVKEKSVNVTRYHLFGVLPILTVKKQGRRTNWLLFNVLPILSSKEKLM